MTGKISEQNIWNLGSVWQTLRFHFWRKPGLYGMWVNSHTSDWAVVLIDAGSPQTAHPIRSHGWVWRSIYLKGFLFQLNFRPVFLPLIWKLMGIGLIMPKKGLLSTWKQLVVYYLWTYWDLGHNVSSTTWGCTGDERHQPDRSSCRLQRHVGRSAAVEATKPWLMGQPRTTMQKRGHNTNISWMSLVSIKFSVTSEDLSYTPTREQAHILWGFWRTNTYNYYCHITSFVMEDPTHESSILGYA